MKKIINQISGGLKNVNLAENKRSLFFAAQSCILICSISCVTETIQRTNKKLISLNVECLEVVRQMIKAKKQLEHMALPVFSKSELMLRKKVLPDGLNGYDKFKPQEALEYAPIPINLTTKKYED